ncbi:hypothetical protein EES41_05905 [Streptomyces sp. ADI95-16]|uniref:nucleotidyltransferase n=1 Tax=Streptomyces sp. ADI95-16 TaxID=1522758 RepID=UPI000F3A928C|nr:nucleotidyltransferase [Streptomyces sp. ADI95-16]AYV26250.1 hypothetical protein EES41_05905 [Streptomyces sp. ADI95-16]
MNEKSLKQLLEEARHQIQVNDDELAEAKRRRQLLANALGRAFPGSTIYFNGSVAHGDANTPLTDVDLGAKLSPDDAEGFGPDGDDALPLMERARDAIREDLADEFPKLTVEVAGRRRAVLVRFGDPVTASQPDFTADVMTAIPHPSGNGLFIPNMEVADKWDRADPITHTEMVLDAIDKTENTFARTVRLLKHWNCTHSKPLCSWNIKALALQCITTPMPLAEAIQAFFAHAAQEFESGQTDDPAGVAGLIPLNLPIGEVRKRLDTARAYIDLAIEHEAEGRPLSAQHVLNKVLPEIVPDADASAEEAARLRRAAILSGSAASGLGLVGPGVTRTRAWTP